MHASPMEDKILPPKKRKLGRRFLEENGTMYRSSEQGITHCDSLPEINSFAPKTAHGVHCSQSLQLKNQSGEVSIKLDGRSLVLDAVGEQGKCTTIERRASDFNENPHPESAQKYRKSSMANKSCHPDTALVKTSQQGSSVSCPSDTEVFTVLMKGSDEVIDEFDCPSLPSHKAAPVASQKIWEGSMQFNPNTNVPILAFLKSGQKLFDISWSALVVIKGKITLEDFEKYIKDLPRSRTRNLMVISLCWKPGSSSAGLECLKKVVKQYEMNKQVAFAQPSPDVSLYLYPWDEVITALLVKYGYLEEKAVIADRSELLIGCVVWRRKQMPSISITYQSENRAAKQLQNLSIGNDKDIPGLMLPMFEPSSVEKKESSTASHSESSKTSSRDLPLNCPGQPIPSEFPKSLASSHEPKQFNGGPPLRSPDQLIPSEFPKSLASSHEPKRFIGGHPLRSPGQLIPSEFPKSLASSHEPKRFNGGRPLRTPGQPIPSEFPKSLASSHESKLFNGGHPLRTPGQAFPSEFPKSLASSHEPKLFNGGRPLMRSPGQLIPSEFPKSLASCHEPKRFNGRPPLRSPGQPIPSEFPKNLASSHEPKRFNGGGPPLRIPNQHNSLSRNFTFLRNLIGPSSVPDVDHPSAD